MMGDFKLVSGSYGVSTLSYLSFYEATTKSGRVAGF